MLTLVLRLFLFSLSEHLGNMITIFTVLKIKFTLSLYKAHQESTSKVNDGLLKLLLMIQFVNNKSILILSHCLGPEPQMFQYLSLHYGLCSMFP